MSGSERDGTPRSKVIRLIEKYDLHGTGEELELRWTAEDTAERLSLRDLADYFNRQILQTALESTDRESLDSEVANMYRLLTDDDQGRADRTRIERRLERDGIDVEELRSDFVSYQTIRRFLNNHRETEYEATTESVERTMETLQRLRSRVSSVTESKVDNLKRTSDLTLGGEIHTMVTIQIFCEECESQFDITELVERGRCDCA